MTHKDLTSAGAENERPGGASPGAMPRQKGVAVERVDPETLRLVNALFPRSQGDRRRGQGGRRYAQHSGEAFLIAFLSLSYADQYILPTLRETSVAVLSGYSVQDVARHLGWSNEVTNKYFIVWTTLHLILQERVGRQVTYYFPLTCYAPRLSTVRALDALIAENDPHAGYRDAVKKLAVRVRERFLDYYGISPAVLADLERLDSPLLVQALQGVGTLLATCGLEPEVANRLSLDLVLQVIAPLLTAVGQEKLLLPRGSVDSGARSLAGPGQVSQVALAALCRQEGKVDSGTQSSVGGNLGTCVACGDSVVLASSSAPRNLVVVGEANRGDATIVDSEGDGGRTSRIESVSLYKKNRSKKDISLELEGAAGEQTESSCAHAAQATRSDAALRAEAAVIGARLDGAGCADEQDGHWVGAPYIGRLKAKPREVRMAMVAVLMQTYFAETYPKNYGVPEHPGMLFNTLYKLYARERHPRQPSEEVLSWVDSPYSYQQIEQALASERRRQVDLWGVPVSQPMANCQGALDVFGDVPGGAREGPVAEGSTDRRLPAQREAFLCVGAELLEEGTLRILGEELAERAIVTCLGLFDEVRGYGLRGTDQQRRARDAARALLVGGEQTAGQAFALREVRLTLSYLRDFVPREAWEGETGIPEAWTVASCIAEVWPKVRALLLSCQLFEMDDGSLLSQDRYLQLSDRAAAEQAQKDEQEREENSIEYFQQLYASEQAERAGGEREGQVAALEEELEPGPRAVVRPTPWANPVEAALAGGRLRRALDGNLYGMEMRMGARGTAGGVFAIWPSVQEPGVVLGARVLIDNSLDLDLLRAALELRRALDVGAYGVEFQRLAHGPARVKAWSRDVVEEDVVVFEMPDDVYGFIEAVLVGAGKEESGEPPSARPHEAERAG
jgi:hypothetical protein